MKPSSASPGLKIPVIFKIQVPSGDAFLLAAFNDTAAIHFGPSSFNKASLHFPGSCDG